MHSSVNRNHQKCHQPFLIRCQSVIKFNFQIYFIVLRNLYQETEKRTEKVWQIISDVMSLTQVMIALVLVSGWNYAVAIIDTGRVEMSQQISRRHQASRHAPACHVTACQDSPRDQQATSLLISVLACTVTCCDCWRERFIFCEYERTAGSRG